MFCLVPCGRAAPVRSSSRLSCYSLFLCLMFLVRYYNSNPYQFSFYLLSEDSDSIPLNAFSKSRVEIVVITEIPYFSCSVSLQALSTSKHSSLDISYPFDAANIRTLFLSSKLFANYFRFFEVGRPIDIPTKQ